MAPIAIFSKSRLLTSHKNLKSISTFVHLHQEAQLADPPPLPPSPASIPTPMPPNPATGIPLYGENWRSSASSAMIPLGMGFLNPSYTAHVQSLDAGSLMNQFADWMTSHRWSDMEQLFEFWIRSLDRSGKPNKPDVNLYNHYLRTNLMIGASTGELLDLLAQMEDYGSCRILRRSISC